MCVALASAIVGSSPAGIGTFHALCVMAIALAAYAWVIYPTVGSVSLSLVMLVCVLWAWAARQSAALGADAAALVVILVPAAWQQRVRARRCKRMAQVVEDLDEERTVKEQAIACARQTSAALQKKHSRYTQLQSIAEHLSNLTDRQAIASLAVERTFSLIGKSDVCLLFLVDRDRQELSLVASKRREDLPSVRAKHGDQFDRYVLRTQRPLLVNDVRRDFRFTVTIAQERTVSSVIACPLLLGQRAEGVLHMDSAQPSAYTQDDLRFLDILLGLVATALTNAELFAQTEQLAMTDGLTGLTLRRPFLEQLGRELTRSARSRDPVSVLMIDVDEFKQYNDAYGHTAGDLILQAIAGAVRATVPPDGMSARYGGEEFAVLLPKTKRHQASDIAEQIRRTIEARVEGGNRSERRPVTASIGVASFPDDAQADLELIRIADQRLYQAKRAGRNLVCSA